MGHLGRTKYVGPSQTVRGFVVKAYWWKSYNSKTSCRLSCWTSSVQSCLSYDPSSWGGGGGLEEVRRAIRGFYRFGFPVSLFTDKYFSITLLTR